VSEFGCEAGGRLQPLPVLLLPNHGSGASEGRHPSSTARLIPYPSVSAILSLSLSLPPPSLSPFARSPRSAFQAVSHFCQQPYAKSNRHRNRVLGLPRPPSSHPPILLDKATLIGDHMLATLNNNMQPNRVSPSCQLLFPGV
jgi:hypothetical protein